MSLLNILSHFMSVLNSSLVLHDADKNQPLISLIVKPDFIICSMWAGWDWSTSARSRCWRILISCHRLTFSASLCKNINKTGNACITYHSCMFVQPLVQWTSNNYKIFSVCVCSLSYLACNAHAPHGNLWPARPYSIFPLYLMHSTIFKKHYRV